MTVATSKGKRHVKKISFLAAAATFALLACSSNDSTSSSTSTVTGALQTGSFASAPTAVVATNEASVATRASVDAAGAFRLVLVKSHTYHLAVVTGAGQEPIAFPRATNGLGTSLHVDTGAATLALGTITHYGAASTFKSATSAASATCDQGGNDAADGECVNGKDAKTGAACTDPAETDDPADPAQPAAVAAQTIPASIAGCDNGSDGETQD